MRSQLSFAGRFAQLTVVAYLKLVRVALAERLWAVGPRRPRPAAGARLGRAEISA
ncbi:MAG TPA: hypothetical protein VHO06_22250 [Polyangia bacterium]|nr:hypothetical protein [Polyangia bacterium]